MQFTLVIQMLIFRREKNAGIDVISAGWGFRGKEFLLQNGAEKIVQNAHELLEMIL